MVHFNELRIDEKTGKMIVDVEVLTEAKASCYIKKIEVTNQDGFNSTDPASSKMIYTKTYEGEETLAAREFFDTVDNKMYFVMVTWGGTPPLNTACSLDTNPITAATVNMCPIYHKVLSSIKEITNPTCKQDTYRNFINYFLQFKAMQIAVDTEHYNEAITLYNKYFVGESVTPTCGCNRY